MNYLQELWAALDFGSLRNILLRLASVFLCLTTHETCHGLAAYALGDPTAKRMHRLSLNPLRHIDWMGLLMMVTLGFGWAKPVPVDPRYFRKPKQGMALTALAGPASNFLLALVLLVGARIMVDHAAYSALNQGILDFLVSTAVLSIGLGLFNLVPIPPLDGAKVLFSLLPDRMYDTMLRYERIGMFVLWGLVLLDVGAEQRHCVGISDILPDHRPFLRCQHWIIPFSNWKKWYSPKQGRHWRTSRGLWISFCFC